MSEWTSVRLRSFLDSKPEEIVKAARNEKVQKELKDFLVGVTEALRGTGTASASAATARRPQSPPKKKQKMRVIDLDDSSPESSHVAAARPPSPEYLD